MCSTRYGDGFCYDLDVSDNKVIISVIFDDDDSTLRKFVNNVPFKTGLLKFEDENDYYLYKKLIEIVTSVDTHKVNKDSNNFGNEITNNECLNTIISKLISKEQIVTDLVNCYKNNDFEKELYEKGFDFFESIMKGRSLREPYKACVVVMFSYIAMKHYDGDLHSYIKKLYRDNRKETEYRFSDSSIVNCMYEILYPYREEINYFDKKSYVAVPIVLSCVPHYRVYDLFKIAYDIYKKKLLFADDVSNSQIKEKVNEALLSLRRKDLIGNFDTIKGTEYLMSKYTQSCIYSGTSLDGLVDIISTCIRLIINHLTKLEDSFIVKEYYSEGFSHWFKEFDNNVKEKEKYENNRRLSQPYFYFKESEGVHLVTGKCFMDDSYNPNNVILEVYSNGKQIMSIPLNNTNDIEFSDDALGGYIINAKDILIDSSPLNYLSYVIKNENIEIYNSKNRLHRKALFFDGNGKEIKPGTIYDGDVFLISKKDNSSNYGDGITVLKQYDDFFISIIELNSNDVFWIDEEPYVFYKISSPVLFGYEIPWASYISKENKEYKIFKDISLLFRTSCDKEDIYVKIDDTPIYQEDYCDVYYDVSLYADEYNGHYSYRLSIYGLDPGYHTIQVFNRKTDKTISESYFSFIYDDLFYKKFLSKNDGGICYKFNSSFIDKPEIINYLYGLDKYEINCFIKNIGYGKVIIRPSSISFSTDNNKWNDIDKKLYLQELNENNVLYLCAPSDLTVSYFENNNKDSRKPLILNKIKENMYSLELGYLKTLKDRMSIKLCMTFGTREKYILAWYNPYINREECIFKHNENHKTHEFTFFFEGSSKIGVIIKSNPGNKQFSSFDVSSGETISIDETSIDDSIVSFSISLHAINNNSLFNKYSKDPILTFKNYYLKESTFVWNVFPKDMPKVNSLNIARVNLCFSKCESIYLRICPSGFDETICESDIFSDRNYNFNLDSQPYDSYNMLLYKDRNCYIKGEKPFFISKPFRLNPSLLQTNLISKQYIDEEGNMYKAEFSLKFIKIIDYKGKKLLSGYLYNKTSSKEIVSSVVCRNKSDIEIRVYSLKENKLYKLASPNGAPIKSMYIKRK